MKEYFFAEYRRIYPRGKSIVLPKKLYRTLQNRNGEAPFTLYVFRQTWRWPHIELYDDYCKNHEPLEFFEGWDPEIIQIDDSRKIILPKEFKDSLKGLEKKIVITGAGDSMDICSLEVWQENFEPIFHSKSNKQAQEVSA